MLFESEPSSVVLRHYQEEMRDNALKNIFQLKHRGTLCVAPTGTGKSLTMGCTALSASHHGGVLILAHFKGLVRGNRKAVQRLGRDCYVFSGEEKDVIWSDVRKNGAIVSGSVQAILNHLPKIDPSTFKLILIDEGHHAILDSAYDKIKKHFGCPVVLYSATPDRQDGEPLVSDKAMCESVAFNGQTRQFIKDGWILNPEIVFEKSVKLDYSVLGSGSVTEKQAQAAWENTKAHYAVITPFLQKCGDMSAIGFAPSVKLAKLWNDLVNDVRPGKSEYVASYKPGDYTDAKLDFDKDLRRIIEAKFDDFSLQYLWNQGVYLEGADLVAAQVCMLGIVTDSRSKYTQAVGRVLRPCNRDDGKSILTGYERATPAERLALIAASKKKCAYVFDYGGSSGPNKLVHPVDLFGYNHELQEEVRERVIKRMEEIADKGGGDAINLEEIVLEQEESYKQFVVRDRAIRKSLAVEVEVMTRDIDPFGPPEVAGHQRYTLRKVNPPAPKAVEQIRKLTKELGKNYSPDFYRSLTNAKAFAVLNGLRKQADAKRATQPCETWILDKLKSLGNYTTPKSKLEGIRLMQKLEKEKR